MDNLPKPQRRIPIFVSRSRPKRGERGIVMIMTLLSVILVAGMVMFVINLGRQTTRRQFIQDAADATAASGSGWIARSMNTIAMNNVNMARALSLVNVLDAMPMATSFTIEEHEATITAIARQLSAGIPDQWVRDQVDLLEKEINEELDILRPMDAYFTSYDHTRMTFYDGPGGRGQLYASMEAMDGLNTATVDNISELAQTNAIAGGRVNLERADAKSAGFLVPLQPELPIKRGEFQDFERPVLHGLLTDDVDDKEFNRGPFDTIFGWRRLIGGDTPGYWVTTGGGGAPPSGGGSGGVPIGSGAGGGGSKTTKKFIATGPPDPDAYRVTSFPGWMLDRVGHFAGNNLRHSRFMSYESRMARYKLGYLWPGTGPRYIRDPEMITDFLEAAAIAQNEPNRIKETWFIAVEMKSRYPRTHASFMSPGSFSYAVNNGNNTSDIRRVNRWMDPRTWATATEINNWQWRDEWDYEIYEDNAIGIPGQQDATTGEWTPQTAYRIDTFIFLAVNVGEEVEVPNPHNFSGTNDLPAPTDLDHQAIPHGEGDADHPDRLALLNFMAMAQIDDRAVGWRSRFSGAKPYPFQVAVAQSHVFNNHSWDLWTQMWESQLRPIRDVEGWIAKMDEGGSHPDLSDQVVQQLADYMRSLQTYGELVDK